MTATALIAAVGYRTCSRTAASLRHSRAETTIQWRASPPKRRNRGRPSPAYGDQFPHAGQVLQPVHGRLGGQIPTRRQRILGHLEEGIGAQPVRVAAVLVAGGDHLHAKADRVGQAVGGLVPTARIKNAVRDALLMRGTMDFDDLGSYRAFIDEIVSRRNAAHGKRIHAERPHLQELPDRRATDFEEVVVTVSRTGGFTLRKVVYTVPSRLIGHRLRVRLFDDRLEVFIGGTHLMTLPRGRGHAHGRHDQVVNYRHVIPSLKALAEEDLDPIRRITIRARGF